MFLKVYQSNLSIFTDRFVLEFVIKIKLQVYYAICSTFDLAKIKRYQGEPYRDATMAES